MSARRRVAISAIAAIASAGGCSGDSGSTGACKPGTTVECALLEGDTLCRGAQRCHEDGAGYERCRCGAVVAATDGSAGSGGHAAAGRGGTSGLGSGGAGAFAGSGLGGGGTSGVGGGGTGAFGGSGVGAGCTPLACDESGENCPTWSDEPYSCYETDAGRPVVRRLCVGCEAISVSTSVAYGSTVEYYDLETRRLIGTESFYWISLHAGTSACSGSPSICETWTCCPARVCCSVAELLEDLGTDSDGGSGDAEARDAEPRDAGEDVDGGSVDVDAEAVDAAWPS